mmetsp:Transcript_52932/g.114479  ORF Transcript_52932/g.114479 Transcript_52932/m.114479 type:complete len:323 (-) Transcript_52932:240-1208(-)
MMAACFMYISAIVFAAVAQPVLAFSREMSQMLKDEMAPRFSVTDRWGKWKESRGDRHIFMHYLPEQNLVACACGKCGSTSMWGFIYSKVFGHNWTYPGTPVVQDVESERWENKVINVQDRREQRKVFGKASTFALIRDPKDRLISSWKSKVACDGRLGTDVGSREFFTQRLLELAGGGHYDEEAIRNIAHVSCLSLEDFLVAIHKVHQNGHEKFLDRHFLPQNYGCFGSFKPELWDHVVTISDNSTFSILGAQLNSSGSTPVRSHASQAKVYLTPRALGLLDEITIDEYKTLAPYLPGSRIAQPGYYFVQRAESEEIADLIG